MSYFEGGKEIKPGDPGYEQAEAFWKEKERIQQPGEICRESGRFSFFGGESYDRCPSCGRVIHPKATGEVPKHKVPKFIKETW